MANHSRAAAIPSQLGRGPNNWYQSHSDPVRGAYGESRSIHHGSWLEALPEPSPPPPPLFEFDQGACGDPCSTGHGLRQRAPPDPPSHQPISTDERHRSTQGKFLQSIDTLDRMIDKLDRMNDRLDRFLEEISMREPEISLIAMEFSSVASVSVPNPPPLAPDYYSYPQVSMSQFPTQSYQYPQLQYQMLPPTWSPQPSPYSSPPPQYTTTTSSGYHQQSQISMPTYWQQQYQYAPYVFDKMSVRVEALHKEPDTGICVSIRDSLNECAQLSGPLLADREDEGEEKKGYVNNEPGLKSALDVSPSQVDIHEISLPTVTWNSSMCLEGVNHNPITITGETSYVQLEMTRAGTVLVSCSSQPEEEEANEESCCGQSDLNCFDDAGNIGPATCKRGLFFRIWNPGIPYQISEFERKLLIQFLHQKVGGIKKSYVSMFSDFISLRQFGQVCSLKGTAEHVNIKNSAPHMWRTWSLERAGNTVTKFEAAEIVPDEEKIKSNIDFTSDDSLKEERKEVQSVSKVGDRRVCCSYDAKENGQNQLFMRLKHLESEFSSTLDLLRSGDIGGICYKGHDSSLKELQRFSDAWE